MPGGPTWSRDGRAILIGVGEQGNANVKRIDVASGKVDALTSGNWDIMGFSADAAAQRIAFIRSTPTVVGDLQVIDVASPAAARKLTQFNDELFDQLTITEPEELWYTSFDGKKIQGWILKPPAFDASKKYPLILEIHGGPHSAYGNTFTHEFQWMAAKGYVVLYTNPRGSSNYGQDFGNIIQYNYPGDDAKDLMAGVDEILKKGYIDEARMGVTGGSGGGLLTNWVVTQTTRFKAAVSQRDISDWTSFWYTADFTLFTPTWFRKPPFEDPADYVKRSPITYVDKIQTPLMFILGEEDYRTPPAAGGEELFRALKYLKRPTVMVRFPGESHELSRSGRPWHRVERLQHIVGWFDKYLLGKDSGAYDGPRAKTTPAVAAATPGQAAARTQPTVPTRANILRGEYGRYRANNDLLSYHLDVRVDPDKKFLSGKNTIRFKMLQDDTRIQLDLYDNLAVDKILLGTTELKYERELNAVFVDFPEHPEEGQGILDRLPLFGIAARDRPLRRHRLSQGSRRPALDQHGLRRRGLEHLVAEQGSMARRSREHATSASRFPTAWSMSSNGRFVGKTDLGDGYTRWDWHDQLPDQLLQRVAQHRRTTSHFSDKLGDLTLDFYVLPGEPREGQGPVRPGEADDRGVPEVLRRVPVQEGWLQAD